MSDLEKIAQRLGLWRELHEMFNVPRSIAEKFSGTYADQMQLLREIDDRVRLEAGTLKEDLKFAKDSLKERRYLDVAHFINKVNTTLKKITTQISALKTHQDEHIHEFYGEHEHADPEADYFAKSAGLLDFFRSDREKAARVFEKMYRKKLSEANMALNRLFRAAKFLIDWTMSAFKELGKARAGGDIEKYIEIANTLESRRNKFEEEFKKIYHANIAPIAGYLRKRKEEAEERSRAEEKEESSKGPYREPAEVQEEELAQPVATTPYSAPQTTQVTQPTPEPSPEPASSPTPPPSAQPMEQEEQQLSPRLMQKPQQFEYIEVQRDQSGKPVAKRVQQYASYNEADLFLKLSHWLDIVGDEEGSLETLSISEGFFG